ncbi:family 43 glycosylhydrolase [Floccifex sp.]|uniref:family 43 glycosylhydrolase n=1 Tax=Floccifex sp. TaxID=2815810 RepID=UPI003F0D6364
MKKQVYNPYLPSWEYVPDGEPHIFNNRVYVYGSHDRFNGNTYCMEPYVCWSAPVKDLTNWTYHGIIYTGKEDPLNETKKRLMFAPDVVEKNGIYYLFYGLDTSDTISVAKSEKPEGPFTFYGHVHHKDGQILGKKEGDRQQFDPGVFKDDDGQVYLYSGFSSTPKVIERIKKKIQKQGLHIDIDTLMSTSGNLVMKLEDDMLTLKSEPISLLPGVSNSKGTGFEGHEFFEASSMRKFNGMYYAIYSSVNGHELCYAMSKYPDRDFEYKGVLHSNGNIGIKDYPTYYYANNHGSAIEIDGTYYVFGHRHTNYSQYQRQGVAEKLVMNEDGTFNQAEMTSCGLNKGPLQSNQEYPSYIACVLMAKNGACKEDVSIDRDNHPAITQNEQKESYITNIQDGTVIGYKYFDYKNVQTISVVVQSSSNCQFEIYVGKEKVGIIDIQACDSFMNYSTLVSISNQVNDLCFVCRGNSVVDFKSFSIK